MGKQADGYGGARAVAFEVILAFERGTKRRVTELVHERLGAHRLEGRDVGLAEELSLGVVRNWVFLEHALAPFVRSRFRDAPAEGRALLRLGAYQALCLERIPDYALVDQSVELAKRLARGKKLGTFVNAVLRALLRARPAPTIKSGDALRLPDELASRSGSQNPEDFLSITYSYPQWLVSYLLKCYGGIEGTRAFLEFNHSPAPIDLRVNRLLITPEQFLRILEEDEPDIKILGRGRFAPETVRVRGVSRLESRDFFRSGYCYVQDEAEQILGHVVNARAGKRIVDYCAAPGGKATHLAELSGDGGDIIALYIPARAGGSDARLGRVKENCARLGIRSVRAVELGSQEAERLTHEQADTVVVDAPCTGLGTLRRHPDIKLRLKRRDIERMQQVQVEILESAARMVKRGGTLVYCTCTITREENEDVVTRFREAHREFALQTDYSDVPEATRELVTPEGFIRTVPHVHRIDGVFAARLLKP